MSRNTRLYRLSLDTDRLISSSCVPAPHQIRFLRLTTSSPLSKWRKSNRPNLPSNTMPSYTTPYAHFGAVGNADYCMYIGKHCMFVPWPISFFQSDETNSPIRDWSRAMSPYLQKPSWWNDMRVIPKWLAFSNGHGWYFGFFFKGKLSEQGTPHQTATLVSMTRLTLRSSVDNTMGAQRQVPPRVPAPTQRRRSACSVWPTR